MAWCMNSQCGKQNLPKTEVEFDDTTKQVLCRECFAMMFPDGQGPVVLFPPPPPAWSYEVHLTSKDGFAARLGYGKVQLSFHAPQVEILKLFGVGETST